MNEEYTPFEKEIASFFIGCAADEDCRLSRGYSGIIEKINFSLCPSITPEIFYQIENKFFENKTFEQYITYWYELCQFPPRDTIQEKNRQQILGNFEEVSPEIKLNQKMIFSFFCGISDSIPEHFTESQYYKIVDKFLNKISKELCYDEDLERLHDLEDYLWSNFKSFEIRDAMKFKINGRVNWIESTLKEKDPTDEDGAMLRHFQEKYK